MLRRPPLPLIRALWEKLMRRTPCNSQKQGAGEQYLRGKELRVLSPTLLASDLRQLKHPLGANPLGSRQTKAVDQIVGALLYNARCETQRFSGEPERAASLHIGKIPTVGVIPLLHCALVSLRKKSETIRSKIEVSTSNPWC